MVEYLDPATVTSVTVDSTWPRSPYADGYGPKIPTPYRLRLSDGRTRRVYVMCWSNSGTAYVLVKGRTMIIGSDVESMIETARDGS